MATQIIIPVDQPRPITQLRTRGDRVYRLVATAAGLTTLVVLTLIGLFLFIRALPAFRQNGLAFFTTSTWNPDGGVAGVAAVLCGTIEIALIALVLAVPISILTALFVTEYVPPRARSMLTAVIDLLAAIPSLIYGIWGFFFLQPHLLGVAAWMAAHLHVVPIFATPDGPYFASSPFIVGVLIAIMLTPTAASIMRDVFMQAPIAEKEAALALGGSRWRMIKTVVIPFGRGGIVGGSMLALGRAMGESISVALIISAAFKISPHILETGGNTIGALIAERFGDATRSYGLPALMAAALVLFVVTLVVNVLASMVVRRSRSGAGVEV